MAPNSEEDARRLPAKDCASVWAQDDSNKEQRPPVYNAEDYALSLRNWGRRPVPAPCQYTGGPAQPPGIPDQEPRSKTLGRGDKNTTAPRGGEMRDYRNPNLTPTPEGAEMSLKQFNGVSELLAKLKADLRLAFPSFVQEFVGDPLDGVTLLLELLRGVQLSQAAQPARCPPPLLRRALLDEHSCLLCLKLCLRCSDAGRRLAATPAGLFTLAVCIMSNVTKSRVAALQLLTKACQPPGNGHGAVSEALSTLRLRFGEPVRFRFLVGMLTSAGGCPELQAAGVNFLNTFLETAPTQQTRMYIQAELEQAGFHSEVLHEVLPSDPEAADKIVAELTRWERNYVDVAALKTLSDDAEEKTDALQDKVDSLERRVKILLEEKESLLSLEQRLKLRCCQLETEVQTLRLPKRPVVDTDASGSPAEDEGISSSDQDQDEDAEREPLVYEVFAAQNDTILLESGTKMSASTPARAGEVRRNGIVGGDEWRCIGDVTMLETCVDQEEDDETTIDEVIEELRNIINDAESEEYAKDEAERMQKEDERREEKRKIGVKKVVGDYYDSRVKVDVKERKEARTQSRKATTKKTSDYSSMETAPKITIQAKNAFYNNPNNHVVKSGNNKVVNYFKNHSEGKSFGAINVKITSDDNNTIGIKNNSYLNNDAVEVVDAIETELEIVPVKLLPQPPRKSRTVVQIVHGHDYPDDGVVSSATLSPFFDDETPSHTSEEDSDSLLSAARDRRSTNDSLQRNVDIDKRVPPVYKGPDYGHTYRYQVNKPEVVQKRNNVERNNVERNVHAVNGVQRSESLHQIHHDNGKSVEKARQEDAAWSGDRGRRGSFDGLFYVTEAAKTKPVAAVKTAQEQKQWETKRMQSKSLDRIDEGLDSMVDIVISPDRGKSRFSSGRGSSEDWSLEWGDTYGVTSGKTVTNLRETSPVVVVTRSASVQRKTVTTTTTRSHQHPASQPSKDAGFKYGEYQSTRFPQVEDNGNAKSRRYPPDGSSHPLYPPKTPPRSGQFETGSHSPPGSGKTANAFVIKRGHTNAGLYSGHHNIRDAPGQMGVAKQRLPVPDYNGRNVSPVLQSRVLVPKVMDLPSGLY